MIGQTVSHYRILEKLGSGGMGVVYKAEDVRLRRPVALKFIPEDLAQDRTALARFRREAEAASALNHPSICTVYDIDEAGGRPFIVMEYVAGRTLDQRLGRKGLELPDALRYSIQITDALAKAHAAGIVHRDLKPSNIMVTEDGLVKVLDFGLAKLAERPESAEEATRAATERPATEAGTIVGTVAYMSPEQAEGRPVDVRSDIFSFGSVLYEMLTGRRAFHGESKVSTLAAILREEPPPVSGVTARVPAEVDRIVTRCLRKDPHRRWQTMADLRIALEEVKEESESGKPTAPKPKPARARRWVWPVAAVVGVAAVAAGIAWLAARRPPPAFELRPERFTVGTGITDWPAISPDGNLVAYASDRSGEGSLDIYVQHVSVGQPTRLTRHEADDYDPTISPDGAQVVFRSERDGGGLYITETLGGNERLLVPGGRSPSYSPDGSTIACLAGEATGVPPVHRIFLVSARGGPPRPFQPAFGVSASVARATLSWSGDGRHLAFHGVRAGSQAVMDVWVAPLDGGAPIATGGESGNRRPGSLIWDLVGLFGRHLYFCRGSLVEGIHLFRAPLAPGAWTLSGPAEQLTSGGGVHVNLAAASNDRALASIQSVAQDFVSLPLPPARDSATASPAKVTSDATIKGGLSISRDGRTVAYVAYVSWESGRIEIRVRDVATGRESVYRSEALQPMTNPQVSPDGSLVGYAEARSGRYVGFVGASTSLPGRQVCEDCQVTGFFSDSQSAVICYGRDRLVRQHLSTGAQTPILSVAPGVILDARLSPDDRWVAFVVAARDRPVEVFVAPVGLEPAAPPSWRRIVTGRSFVGANWLAAGIRPLVLRPASPAWSADGNELYYLSDRDGRTCVWAQRLGPGTKEPVGDPYALYHLHQLATSPAVFGKAMFLAAARDKLILPEWTVTSNLWTAQLDTVK